MSRISGIAFVAGFCALLSIAGSYMGPQSRWIVYVFKPLTTILIALTVALAPARGRYRTAIFAGLLFSLGGDIFLMLPSDRFLQGLICFLLAHVCYLIAFAGEARFAARFLPFGIIYLFAGAVLSALWNGVPPPMRIPVVIYVLLLATMAAQAGAVALVKLTRGASAAAAGGLLFVVSDACLAINRFSSPFEASTAVVLGTYFTAQYLIAASVRG